MIWKSTSRVGYGYFTMKDPRPQYMKWNLTMVVVVAKYSPPGNYEGRFKSNVFPQKPGCAGSRGCPDTALEHGEFSPPK